MRSRALERRGPHGRVVAVEAAAGGGGIARRARRWPPRAASATRSLLEQVGHGGDGQARPNAVTVAITTPITIARPELATIAQIRRRMLGRL